MEMLLEAVVHGLVSVGVVEFDAVVLLIDVDDAPLLVPAVNAEFVLNVVVMRVGRKDFRNRTISGIKNKICSYPSDCYSFGVLLLQMITGRAPESNETPLQEYVEDLLSTRESYTSPAAGAWPVDHAADLAKLDAVV